MKPLHLPPRPFLLVLLLVSAIVWTTAGALTPAEKATKLAALQAAYAEEVGAAGVGSERALALQAEIAALEAEPVSEPAGTGTTAVGPTTPATAPSDAPTASSSAPHEIKELTRPATYIKQDGVHNPCGPYAISAILQSFGQANDYQQIYRSITPAGGTIGAGPHEIIRYLQGAGHSALERNNGSLDDLANGIDRGERMMMMLNTKDPPEIRGSHWVAVKGYKIIGGKRYWTLVDAKWGEGGDFAPGGLYPDGIPEEEFARMWDTPIGGILGTGAGFHNYYISVGRDGPGIVERLRTTFYGLNETTPAQVLDSGLRDTTRGFWDLFGGDRTVGQRVSGFFTMVGGGVGKIALNAPALIVGGLGNALRDAGGGLRSWASDKWNNGGFFGKVGAVGATLLSGVCTGVGWVFTGAGAIASGLLGAATDLFEGIGSVAGGIIDGIGSLF